MARASRRGGALIIALMTVMGVSSLSAFLFTVHVAGRREQVASIDQKRALYVAEAGLAEGAMAVIQGKRGSVATAEVPAKFGDGVFWVEAAELGNDLVRLKSIGLCGSGRVTLETNIQRTLNPLGTLHLYGETGVTVEPDCIIDGYNSNNGPYTPDPEAAVETTGAGAHVQSNGDVTVQSLLSRGELPTYIFGNVIPGPESGVIQDPSVTITGSSAPAAAPAELPELVVPSPTYAGVLDIDASEFTISGQEVQYGNVSLSNGAKLNVHGPATVVMDDFILPAGCELELDTSQGPVTIYFKGNVNFASGSTVDHSGSGVGYPASLMVTSTNQTEEAAGVAGIGGVEEGDRVYSWHEAKEADVTFASGGELHGLVYAPEVELTFPAALRHFGGVIAASLTIEQGAHITVDHSLETSRIAGHGLPLFIGWRVAENPVVPLVRSPLDPIAQLHLSGTTIYDSSVSHQESKLSIKYIHDGTGLTTNYDGLARNFDWTQARTVVGLLYYDPALDPVPTDGDLEPPRPVMR